MSDPTSSSLNFPSDSIDVAACPGEASSQRSDSHSSEGLTDRNQSRKSPGSGNGKKPVSTIIKTLPRAIRSRGPSLSHRGQASVGFTVEDQHRHQEMHLHDGHSVQFREVHMHDDGVRTLNVGVDPVEFGRVVSESQRLLDKSESKARSLEGLAQSTLCKPALKSNIS